MARNRIFISYCHGEDKPFFDEWLIHLKPWRDRCLFDVWTDQDIPPGADWHAKIQEAIDATAVAVLLVSHYFMASDYIRQHEVPSLLKARGEGKLGLACLYLRPNQADSLPFEVPLGDGQTRPIVLSKYQSLNDPGKPLAALEKAEQDACLNKAVADIRKLYEQHAEKEVVRHRPGQRHELTIRLDLVGDRLYRSFHTQQTRLATGCSMWPPLRQRLEVWKRRGASALGQDSELPNALYETLFGASQEDQTGTVTVLQRLFPAAARPTPIFSPLRVRIQTTEALLADLPWTRTAWEHKRLGDPDTGWTFELLADEATPDEIAAFPNTRLHAPCPVLLIAPRAAHESESHLLAVEGRLDHAWPAYRERLPQVGTQQVGTRQQIADALQKCHAGILYYYGPAQSDGQTLRLQLDDGPLEVSDLTTFWKRAPQIVFFNLLEDSSPGWGSALAALHSQLPLLIAQTSNPADAEQARQAAQNWLVAFLQGGEDPDPIALFHQHGLATAQVWGRYGQWRYSPQVVSPREKLARLLLDRENQRRAVQGVVSALVNDSGRRLSCLLAYGDESDLVHLFVDQLLEYLRQHSRREAHVLRVRLPLPPAESFTSAQLRDRVCRHFRLNPPEPLRKGLERQKRPTPERARLVLLLDWGVRGTADTFRISGDSLRAWVEFCAGELAEQCPPDMRLLSVLTLESPRERHAGIAARVEGLRKDPGFAKRSFTMEHLEPLSVVREGDLVGFLKDEHTSCPQALLPVMPKLIWQLTLGRFDETVELIEKAEEVGVRGWIELHAKHKDSLPPDSPTPVPDDDLL